MDTTIQQLFLTLIAAFAFLILIAKIASPARPNGAADHPQAPTIRHLSNTVYPHELKSSKRKSTKKVRFAVDHVEHDEHDKFVVNRAVAGPSEVNSVVFEKNHGEIEDNCGNDRRDSIETVSYGVHGVKDEAVSDCADCDQPKEVKSELVEGAMVCEENVGNCSEIETCVELLCDDGIDEAEKEKEGLISEEDESDDDDDWEGVERSELEKVFAIAADYGKVNENVESLESDIQMQLYALHKVATEGPCHEAQPMALKISARAKWNSWQKLGNMNPDVAMEQYIALLSEFVPEWSQGIHSFDKH